MFRLLQLPQRAPRATLALIALATVFFGYFARSLRFDSSVENLLPGNDPERIYYEAVRREFGSEEATVIGVFADDVLSVATATKIAALSAELAAIDGVRDVVSLSTVEEAEVEDGVLRIVPLMRQPPRDAAEADRVRARALANPLYARNLIAADSRAAAISVFFDPMSDDDFLQRGIADHIAAAVERARGPEEIEITGIPTLKVAAARYMLGDTLRFLPLGTLAVVAVMLWAFGTLRGVLLPLLTVLVGVVWTVGLMSLTGAAINMGTLVLSPMLMAVGISYAIHIMSQYYRDLEPNRPPGDVVAAAVREINVPLALAAFTTLAGFATYIFNSIPAIREFGIYSVFGVAAIYFLSVALLPAALVLLPAPRRGSRLHDSDTRLGRLLRRIGRLVIERSRLVLAISTLVCLVIALQMSRLRVETDYLDFFKPSDPVRLATQRVGAQLAGAQPISIIVDGGDPNTLDRPEILHAIAALQTFLAGLPGVDTSLSIVDELRLLQKALDPGGPELPATQAEVEQLLVFLSPEQRHAVLNDARSRANVVVRTHLSGSVEVRAFVDSVRLYAAEHFPSRVDVRPTGTVVLLDRSADQLAWGQITSLWQVLFVLLAIMSALFLSLRIGLLSLVPNVVPILVLFGVMGASGISLSISTSLIAAFAIGIAIDDTIHYLNAFNQEMRRTGDQTEAVRNAMNGMGKPMIVTTVALSAGFLVVCLSHFRPVQYFGVLSSLTMATALLADLFITPAIARATRIITLWEVLFVVVGPDPHKQIPLFRGLWAFQAKIAALLTHLAKAPAGTELARHGEQSGAMYVMLSGLAEVRRGNGPPLRQLARGDVIGEMGLLRGRPRSADVVVVQDAEYLVIDGPSLQRIRRRHPRIASVLLFNLSLMLSDRLENTTEQLVRRESTPPAALAGSAPQTAAPPGPDPLPAARGAE